MGVIESKRRGFDKYLERVDRALDPRTGLAASTTHMVAGKVNTILVKHTPYRDHELPQTPVKRKPGDLQRGWTGGRKRSPENYAKKLYAQRVFTGYEVELENVMDFSSYVQYGHAQHPGQWVPPIQKRLVADRVEPVNFLGAAFAECEVGGIEALANAPFQKLCNRFLR